MKVLVIGYLLFVVKRSQTEQLYVSIRYMNLETRRKWLRWSFVYTSAIEYLTANYDLNEIASIHIKNIFKNLKHVKFRFVMGFIKVQLHRWTLQCNVQ